jgi:hypothetical protein
MGKGLLSDWESGSDEESSIITSGSVREEESVREKFSP